MTMIVTSIPSTTAPPTAPTSGTTSDDTSRATGGGAMVPLTTATILVLITFTLSTTEVSSDVTIIEDEGVVAIRVKPAS